MAHQKSPVALFRLAVALPAEASLRPGLGLSWSFRAEGLPAEPGSPPAVPHGYATSRWVSVTREVP